MSAEAWALAGVVVGAVLGGVAQMAGDALRRRHEREAATKEARRLVYTDWIRLLHKMDMTLNRTLTSMGEAVDDITANPVWADRKLGSLRAWVDTLPDDENDPKVLSRLALSMLWVKLLLAYRRVARKVPQLIDDPEIVQMHADVRQFNELALEIGTEQAALRLVAPDDTYAAGIAARKVFASVNEIDIETPDWREKLEAGREAFYPVRDEFVRLAKRDLGIN